MGRDTGDAYRRKAASTFAEAKALYDQKRWSGASNRTYYSLYQALVALFEDRDRKPGEFRKLARGEDPKSWPHDVVKNNLGLIGHGSAEAKELFSAVQGFRVKADYRRDPVEQCEIDDIFSDVREFLEELSVSVAA